MFSVDSHFEIGSSHKVCEDFAIHGSFEAPDGELLHYGIVADGYSSSMMKNGIRLPVNVDTGARLLALAAKQAIREIVPMLEQLEYSLRHTLRNSILHKIDILIRQLGLPVSAVDCTLLINLVYRNRVLSIIHGDGIVVHRSDKATTIEIIEFESGAPYYLSYALDDSRNSRYMDKFGGSKKTRKVIRLCDGSVEVFVEEAPLYESSTYLYSADIIDTKSISIISDGALTFQQSIEGQSEKRLIPLEEVIPKLVNLKSTKGNFLGRVMNLLHRWEKKEQIDHYDDLAIATIAEVEDAQD